MSQLRRIRGNAVLVRFLDFETFFIANRNVDIDNRGEPVCKRNFVLHPGPDFVDDFQHVFAKDVSVPLLYEQNANTVQVSENFFVFLCV